MARILDRQKAIKLRKQGKTYSEIKQIISASKSTLNYWLRNHPLTETQFKLLEKNIQSRKYLAIEKVRATKLKKRELRLKRIYSREYKRLPPLSKRELHVAGLFLYWGEGLKNINAAVGLNNSDPMVVKFYLYWLTRILNVSRRKLRVYVHLYKDMNTQVELKFWSNKLGLSLNHFGKPYIKLSTRKGIGHKGFGHGTCGIYVQDVRLKKKIIKGIEVISDYYSGK